MRRQDMHAWLWAGLLACLFACGSDDPSGDGPDAATADAEAIDEEGARMCCELGEICHEVDDRDGELAACHDLGHANDPVACRSEYARCRAACLDAGAEDSARLACE